MQARKPDPKKENEQEIHFSPTEYPIFIGVRFKTATRGVFRKKNYLQVSSIVANSPCTDKFRLMPFSSGRLDHLWLNSLEVGDIIRKINQQVITPENYQDILKPLRKEMLYQIKILRQGKKHILHVYTGDASELLQHAVFYGFKETAHSLIVEAKAQADTYNKFNRTPLIYTTMQNDQELTRDLIVEAKANPDLQDAKGNTALIHAAKQNHKEIARDLLVEAKAAPDIQNEDGDTALICAASKNHQEITHDLVEAKADPDIQNKDGNTALICAAYEGHKEIAHDLIKVGAKLELANATGQTALDVAIQWKNLSIVSLLLSHGALARHSNELFNFLQSCDPKNQDVLVSLYYLSEQLTNSKGVANLFIEVNSLIKKLNGHVVALPKDIKPSSPNARLAPAAAPAQPAPNAPVVIIATEEKPLTLPVQVSPPRHSIALTYQQRLDNIGFNISELDEKYEQYVDFFTDNIINTPVSFSSGILYDKNSLIEYMKKSAKTDGESGMKYVLDPKNPNKRITEKELNEVELNIFAKDAIEKFVLRQEKKAHAKKQAAASEMQVSPTQTRTPVSQTDAVPYSSPSSSTVMRDATGITLFGKSDSRSSVSSSSLTRSETMSSSSTSSENSSPISDSSQKRSLVTM